MKTNSELTPQPPSEESIVLVLDSEGKFRYWDFFKGKFGFHLADRMNDSWQGIDGCAQPFHTPGEALKWCADRNHFDAARSLLDQIEAQSGEAEGVEEEPPVTDFASIATQI